MRSKFAHVLAGGALAAAVALAVPSASAADLRAEIPFAFQVGERTLPAGTYQVSTAQSMLGLRSIEGGVFVMTGRLESGVWREPTLVFERTGARYVLRQAWTGGGNGRAVPHGGTDGVASRSRSGAVAHDVAQVSVPLL
jgi:hypothetical protein